ncbi:MAG: type II secretion protein [Deltaproteobacteria bacterium]|nr:type II secretion protein [Deltaproteobacteria bacterium]
MMNHEFNKATDSERLFNLLKTGILTEKQLETAAAGAAFRGIDVEKILRHDYHVPRRHILEALSAYYKCPWVEYDERMPVPAELLLPFVSQTVRPGCWFPVIMDGEKVVIAATNPYDQDLRAEAKAAFPDNELEFRVALAEDIRYFLDDFLNSHPDHLVGSERTDLAMWRNTMARWRTKLACYRTDFARVRTYFSLLRGGLGLIAIARALMHMYPESPFYFSYWIMVGVAFCLICMGLYHYIRIRKNVLSPPRHQTLVEVSAAVLYFLENYQFVETRPSGTAPGKTMLARLAESLLRHSVDVEYSFDNKDRSYFAHLRTLRAAQRTIAGCYRTVYARARTGLSFIRTGAAFLAIGIGLIRYFGFSLLTGFDLFLVGASICMLADGAFWYLPAKREQSGIPEFITRDY